MMHDDTIRGGTICDRMQNLLFEVGYKTLKMIK